MKGPRNPFFIRIAEQFRLETDFLKMFSPGILDILPESGLWDRVNVFRSAPGGGKTSLLKLFSASVLLTLYSYKKSELYKDIFIRMKEIGAIDDDGPCVLATILPCTYNYASLEDLNIDNARKERLLLALLNSRIILSLLHSAMVLKRRNYPDDLDDLQLECLPGAPLPPGIPQKGSGRDYFNWACTLEERICEAIDSLIQPEKTEVLGHDSLFSLWLFNPQSFLYKSDPVADKIVVMLDDVHKLTTRQRKKLLSLIVDLRSPAKIWIAERLEALSTDELLSSGNIEGRDWNPIYLESYWQNHKRQFELFATNVADKRAEYASEREIGSFSGCLQEAPVNEDLQKQYIPAFNNVKQRVNSLAKANQRYVKWLDFKEKTEGSIIEKLFGWRALEILIRRDLGKKQKSFDFLELTEDNLQSQDGTDVQSAAELFIAKEFKIPYYYGFNRLCAMSSGNIEQFLDLAGELFEEVASESLLSLAKKSPEIRAERQEKILKQAAQKRWEDVIRLVENPNNIRSFVESVGEFSRWETYKPNAPYSPGVTGIAIKMSDREKLRDQDFLKKDGYSVLAKTLATCLSYNIFEPALDHKCKGQRWMVLYLNRMFCVYFDLPLQYGGWREKSLKELLHWIDKGFRSPKSLGGFF